MRKHLAFILSALAFFVSFYVALSDHAMAQATNGKVTTSAPTYVNNTLGALSLDTNGNLRVVTSGGGGGTSAVNLVQVGGTNVSNTTPGLLDINCLSGCVAGSGVVQAQATTAPPSYVNGTPNPVSMDLSGNLRVIVGNTSIPVTGPIAIDQTTPGTTNGVVLNAGANLVGIVNTRFGTALSPSDATSNTSAVSQITDGGGTGRPGVETFGMMFNGTTWDRLRGTAANGLTVSVGTALPAGSAIIGKVGIDQTTPGTTNGVQVNAALPAGGNIIGQTVPVSGTATGTISFHLIAANSNNSTLISTGAHSVYEMSMGNNSANIAYLKIYDKSTAPTCGTDTPIATYIIPGASTGGAGSNVSPSIGKAVTNGLGICVTGGIADNDNTSVAASAYAINVTYR